MVQVTDVINPKNCSELLPFSRQMYHATLIMKCDTAGLEDWEITPKIELALGFQKASERTENGLLSNVCITIVD